MSVKIAFIGAGSLGFAKRLFIDLVNKPALRGAHFAMMDVDETYLSYTCELVKRVIEEQKLPTKFSATTNQREAIKDADFVVIMIRTHGAQALRAEYEIPLKYGVDQCIGDTLGPGGVFRFLRTAPYIESICQDTLELAKPDAWILNYTNPMAMLTWMSYEMCPEANFVGLCHSVQGTTQELASMINVSYKDIKYWVAGINHQAWILEFKKKDGTDLYPRLREELPKSKYYKKYIEGVKSERVRIDMMKHLGYFVTESSGHNSEYNAWYRKRKDLIDEYCGIEWAGQSGYILKLYGEDRENYEKKLKGEIKQKDPIDFSMTVEYCATIIDAVCTDIPAVINGNVKNTNLITNLPGGACVEVPCLVNGHGVNPCYVGELPPQCAALNRTNINEQGLAVLAYKEKSRERVYQALYYDPLTSAKLSLAEIRTMVDEMFEFEKKQGWLPDLR